MRNQHALSKIRVKYFLYHFCFCMLVLLSAGSADAGNWQWIDGQRLMSRMKEGGGQWLIDVRNAAAYEAVHIEGSMNIPAETLAQKMIPRQKILVLTDNALGQKAARGAADLLVQKGYERVFVLQGGVSGWKAEGFPVVERALPDAGVTAGDLKWALAQSVPVKIYDLRNAKEREGRTVEKGEAVPGRTVSERMEKLQSMLQGGQKRDLSERLKQPVSVVLIFPATEDAAAHVQRLILHTKTDVRYLIGGYEAMVSDGAQAVQKLASCPTCPKKGK